MCWWTRFGTVVLVVTALRIFPVFPIVTIRTFTAVFVVPIAGIIIPLVSLASLLSVCIVVRLIAVRTVLPLWFVRSCGFFSVFCTLVRTLSRKDVGLTGTRPIGAGWCANCDIVGVVCIEVTSRCNVESCQTTSILTDQLGRFNSAFTRASIEEIRRTGILTCCILEWCADKDIGAFVTVDIARTGD